MSSLLLFMCFFSILLMIFKNPLSKGYMLLLMTISASLYTSMMYLNAWFGYILFLVMIGGMLVAFIYMTSVASNEKFSLPKTSTFMMVLISMIALVSFAFIFPLFKTSGMEILSSQEILFSKNMSLKKIFSYPIMQLSIALMNYLLLTLIMVVKITEFNKGPIRQK
uniref:NADH-ubiquinone oxidoreductase chain 6 n=1 Tax=Scolytinae sp. BMNH 1274299 TaxID=2558041 RepID=A0A126TE10_9CUCU|nr:NADH dehydrogenase subunit 6 [Scolytinae sp. BMNH 1274299]